MTRNPYPLQWPAGVERTPANIREVGRFDTTIHNAMRGIFRELELFGATDVTITSNAALNRDGSISSRQPYMPDSGVAVYFTLRGQHRCLPCDRYQLLAHNLRAIQRTIEAMRGIERWGTKSTIEATLGAFSLPDGMSTQWWEILEVSQSAPPAVISAAYRVKARQVHPDVGGNAEAFHQLQQAYEQAVAERSL
jgi:hypothetical protein